MVFAQFGTRHGCSGCSGCRGSGGIKFCSGPPFPHAQGARMTAVTQTPSNYFSYLFPVPFLKTSSSTPSESPRGLQRAPKSSKEFQRAPEPDSSKERAPESSENSMELQRAPGRCREPKRAAEMPGHWTLIACCPCEQGLVNFVPHLWAGIRISGCSRSRSVLLGGWSNSAKRVEYSAYRSYVFVCS